MYVVEVYLKTKKPAVANGQLQCHHLKSKGIRVSIKQSNREEKEMEILH